VAGPATAAICDEAQSEGLEGPVHRPHRPGARRYFAGTKLRWVLDHVTGARALAESCGALCFGTVDSWLIWNLTGGRVLPMPATRRARCCTTSITGLWDDKLLGLLSIPRSRCLGRGFIGSVADTDPGCSVRRSR
jgi:glycerol kinase